MDVTQLAAYEVTTMAALTRQAASMSIMKKAAAAQMQLANVVAQQAQQVKPQEGFSVYA